MCHNERHVMEHFEYLHDSRMIYLPFNFSEKLHWQHLFEKLGEAEAIITFISVNTIQHPLILKSNIDHSSKQGPPPFFHLDTSPVLCHSLVHFDDKTHVLAEKVELIWCFFLNIVSFNFVEMPNKSFRFSPINM